jgi:pyrimidine-nucleoside phosphorylase
MLNENISNGKGLEKLKQLIKAQGGNPLVCDDYSLFPSAKESYTLTAWQSGCITSIATDEIGRASVATGAGRVIKDSPIDLSAGIIMKATVGDYVNKGDAICDVLAGELEMCKSAADIIKSAITISDTKPNELAPVLEVIE